MARRPLTFITSILTLGAFIATLAVAAPAQAASDKTKAVLGAAATLWLVHEMNRKGVFDGMNWQTSRDGAHSRSRDHGADHRQGHGGRDWRHGGGRKTAPQANLPRRCLQDTRRQGLVMDARCLRRQEVRLRALPQRCGTQYRARGAWRHGFDYACLRKFGHRLARR